MGVRKIHPNSLNNLKPWPDGISNNPGGVSKVVQGALQYARSKSKEAMITLWCIACDDSAKNQDRLKAIELLLDRGLGKPAQMNLNVNADGSLTSQEIGMLARAVVKSIEGGDAFAPDQEVIDLIPENIDEEEDP